MISEPKLEQRTAQPYVAIRTTAPMPNWGHLLGPLWGEVYGWLEQHGVAPAGPPLIRYLMIEMETHLEIEVGVPVAAPVAGEGRITAGTLPAGRYVTLIHRGDYSGLMDATGALLAWGEQQGLTWQTEQTPEGEVWGGRIESYLTDPQEEPDPAKWQTELAFLVAGAPAR